jgi:hypothetical protein
MRLDAASVADRVIISVKGGSRRSWPDADAVREDAREGAGLHASSLRAAAAPDPTQTVGMPETETSDRRSSRDVTARESPAKLPILPFVQPSGDAEPQLGYPRAPHPMPETPPPDDSGETLPGLRADLQLAPPLPFASAKEKGGFLDRSTASGSSPGLVSPPPLILPPRVGAKPRAADAGSGGATPPVMAESPWAGGPGRPPPLTIGQGGMPSVEQPVGVPPPDLVRSVHPAPDARPPAAQLAGIGNESQDDRKIGSSEAPPARPKVASLASLRRTSAKAGEIPGGPLADSKAAAASAGQPPLVPAPRPSPAAVVELLWFDPAFSDSIRAEPRWKELLAEVKPKPRDADFTDSSPPEKRQEARDRREITAILARGAPSAVDELSAALASAVDEDGRFVPPLVLLAGDIEFPFDELETLKATIAAVTPLVAGDKKLKEAVDTMNDLLRTPWIQGASSVTEGLTAQLKEAFAQGNRILPPRYLENHTERILLEQRHYQRRAVFGQPWIRSIFTPLGSTQSIPSYLPMDLTRALPMFQRLQALLIAELHIQLDQYESYPNALRIVALGRTLRSAGRR